MISFDNYLSSQDNKLNRTVERKERKKEILEAKKVTQVKKGGGGEEVRKSWEARGLFAAAGGEAKEMVAEEEGTSRGVEDRDSPVTSRLRSHTCARPRFDSEPATYFSNRHVLQAASHASPL